MQSWIQPWTSQLWQPSAPFLAELICIGLSVTLLVGDLADLPILAPGKCPLSPLFGRREKMPRGLLRQRALSDEASPEAQ